MFPERPRYTKYLTSISSPSEVRQKQVPWAALPKSRMLDTCYTLPFPSQGRNFKLSVFSQSSWALSVCGRVITSRMKGFSCLFQYSCSQLCAPLGYCDFFTGFWSSHKGILFCVLLLSWCFYVGKQGKSFRILLTSYSLPITFFISQQGCHVLKQNQSDLKLLFWAHVFSKHR